ncbi:MAG: hypothetical protein EOT05_04250 [Candidatus Microsaccharimonas sossegonensis]|uniref:Elongation factor G-binding protein C-terminal treble-clef zinc-finger domain-containing protein n=1 Tax=Candidatus Microsaccharimonas sossegonensis TaxID=2506948 RepID=A0A4Q0AIE7_9BACT|nr:MAG: hypothetical protein EOT05_04250 [Candidatus Microsaccharimonas sossegonensis]
MRVISTKLANEIITKLRISKNLQKRLRLSAFGDISETEWKHYEIIGLPTKDGAAGVLFIEIEDDLYAIPYEIGAVGDKLTGRSKPVICDLCKTWQAGGRAGSITFRTERRSLNSISFLCCLDLKCSLHVRDMTTAAKTSRAQLREDITQQYRIERLKDKLSMLVKRLGLEPAIDKDEDIE